MSRRPLPENLRSLALPLGCALAFALLKISSLRPQVSDENIYFFMARLIVEGQVPYRDFFYSGTPLPLYLLAIPAALAPQSIVAFKLAPLFCASALVGVFAAGLQRAWGGAAALIGVLVLFSSESFLKATSHATGINLAMLGAWMALGWALSGRARLAGLGLALGAGGKLLAATVAPAVLLLLWRQAPPPRRRRATLECLGVAGLLFAGGMLPFLLLAPGETWQGMVQYHFNKLARPDQDAQRWAAALAGNALHFGLAGGALLFWSLFRRTRDRLALACGVYLVFHVLFLLTQKRVWPFYFDPLMPVAGALGAWLFVEARGLAAGSHLARAIPAAVVAALALPLFFSIRNTLEHEARYLRVAAPMAEYLAARAPEGGAVFGDSTSAPLLALLSGLPVAGNEVDTNAMRFSSRTSSLPAVLDRAKEPPVTFIVARYYVPPPGGRRVWFGIAGFGEFQRLVEGLPSREFHNPGKGTYVIYELTRVSG